MNANEKSVDDLRAEIDRIDAALQDLIQRRAGVVKAIAAGKSALPGAAGATFHPAREARILRRLVAANQGPLPAAAMALIWRTLIGAFLRFQTPLSIAVCGGDDHLGFHDLVRAHFGAALPIRVHDRADQVLGTVAHDDRVIGVVARPLDDEPAPWWPQLVHEGVGTPRIVACLPFVEVAGAANRDAGALVLVQTARGDSGADTTFAVIATDDAVSRTRLIHWLKAAGYTGAHIESRHQISKGGAWLHLVRLPGYLDTAAEILEPLGKISDGAVGHVVVIGGYADPIQITDGERS